MEVTIQWFDHETWILPVEAAVGTEDLLTFWTLVWLLTGMDPVKNSIILVILNRQLLETWSFLFTQRYILTESL